MENDVHLSVIGLNKQRNDNIKLVIIGFSMQLRNQISIPKLGEASSKPHCETANP